MFYTISECSHQFFKKNYFPFMPVHVSSLHQGVVFVSCSPRVQGEVSNPPRASRQQILLAAALLCLNSAQKGH